MLLQELLYVVQRLFRQLQRRVHALVPRVRLLLRVRHELIQQDVPLHCRAATGRRGSWGVSCSARPPWGVDGRCLGAVCGVRPRTCKLLGAHHSQPGNVRVCDGLVEPLSPVLGVLSHQGPEADGRDEAESELLRGFRVLPGRLGAHERPLLRHLDDLVLNVLPLRAASASAGAPHRPTAQG